MLTHHRCAPGCSRSPHIILWPCLSWILSTCLSIYMVRLFVKPGMMCLVRACSVGICGNKRTTAPEELFSSPVAVQMVSLGAMRSMLSSGAAIVK